MYVDTSALVAYYCPEKISDQVENILLGIDRPVISQLTEVELASAIARKIREKNMTREDGDAVLSMFQNHIDEKGFVCLPVEPQHFILAMKWISAFNTPLRTLDALHLAIAKHRNLRLLTADKLLAKSAEKLGVSVKQVN